MGSISRLCVDAYILVLALSNYVQDTSSRNMLSFLSGQQAIAFTLRDSFTGDALICGALQ
jgi:hypothetical protein